MMKNKIITSIGAGTLAGLCAYGHQDIAITGAITVVAGGTMFYLIDLINSLLMQKVEEINTAQAQNIASLSEAHTQDITRLNEAHAQDIASINEVQAQALNEINKEINSQAQYIQALEKTLADSLMQYKSVQDYTQEILAFMKEAIGKIEVIPTHYEAITNQVKKLQGENSDFSKQATKLLTLLEQTSEGNTKVVSDAIQIMIEQVEKSIEAQAEGQKGLQEELNTQILELIKRLENAMATQMMQDRKTSKELQELIIKENKGLIKNLNANNKDFIEEQKKQQQPIKERMSELIEVQKEVQENILMLNETAAQQMKIIGNMQEELVDVNKKDLEVLGKLLNV